MNIRDHALKVLGLQQLWQGNEDPDIDADIELEFMNAAYTLATRIANYEHMEV